MDRLIREANPPTGQLASPVPQYKRPGSTDYEAVEGQHGAPFATLKDASGNVVSPATEDKLEQVRQLLAGVATENKLEQARTLLDAISTKDFATQTTLAAVLAKLADLESELQTIKANQLSGDQKVTLSGINAELEALMQGFATEDKLEQVRQLLTGVATENKLEQARTLLDAISTKDFATQTTLAAVLAKLEQLETEIQAVKANQLSGDQKVQLSGTIAQRYIVSDFPEGNLLIGDNTHTAGGAPVKALDIRNLSKAYMEVRNTGDSSAPGFRVCFGVDPVFNHMNADRDVVVGDLPAGATLKIQLVEHLDALVPEDTLQIVKDWFPYVCFRMWLTGTSTIETIFTGGVA